MSVMDWSKFSEAQTPRKLLLEAKRRKLSTQGTQSKTMSMSVWRAQVVKPMREPICDRCMTPGPWANDRNGSVQNAVQILSMVRGAGMIIENAALVCNRCSADFYAMRKAFKMKAHYALWIARHHKLISTRDELLSTKTTKRSTSEPEQIDDEEFQRLLDRVD